MIDAPQPEPPDPEEILKDLRVRAPGYTPELTFTGGTAGDALAAIFARYAHAVLQRLHQAPEKNKLAFLDLLGLQLTPAQSAGAALVFQLNEKASSGIVPAGTPVAAPPPPGGSGQIVFETIQACSLLAGKLAEVFSLFPGKDSYIDHSAAIAAGEPIRLFAADQLEMIPHHLYLAHRQLFALSGTTTLNLEFQFQRLAGKKLDIEWEFWDGKVWRGFFDLNLPSGLAAEPPDGTLGMSENGRIELTANGATAAETAVAGISNFWLRGRLTKRLIAAGTDLLPLIELIRLSSTVEQPFRADFRRSLVDNNVQERQIAVVNSAGELLVQATVAVDDPPLPLTPTSTDSGVYEVPSGSDPKSVTVSFFDIQGGVTVDERVEVSKRLNVELHLAGIAPDAAKADGTKLDTTKPFYPFGQQPQPGSTFYFSSQEAFSKPGALLRVYLPLTSSPIGDIPKTDQDKARRELPVRIDWEYWNGRTWAVLSAAPSNQGKRDFKQSEIIDFTVPVDMEPTTVAGTDGLWVRARVASGGFGFQQDVSWQATSVKDPPVINTFTYTVHQPPILAAIQLSYTWQFGPFRPENAITYNDFQYRDRTDSALGPGASFAPYERSADLTPALYLGFEKQPPSGQIGILLNVQEQRGDDQGPELTWEYWDGQAWNHLLSEDETRDLRVPGIVSLVTEEDSAPLTRFDAQALHWARGRMKEDGEPGEPVVNAIYPNAVLAAQRTSLRDVPIGQSDGNVDQTFSIPQVPILNGERIEVRELAGARAPVEWRLLAMELSQGVPHFLPGLEQQLAREGGDPDITAGDLRLRRDRLKKVTEAWVRWSPKETLAGCGPLDRCYTIDRGRGMLTFGDGKTGRVPPDGAAVLGRFLQSGGGSAGNVPAKAISQIRGVVPGVQAAFNPLPAEGGSDGEPLSDFVRRGPTTLRHRGRAVAAADYAALAREASSAVGFARAIPTQNGAGHSLPGWVTVVIIPHSQEERPQPTFGLRQQVQQFIAGRAAGELAHDQRILVVGPEYLEIDVAAAIAPKDESDSGPTEQRTRDALNAFFHPVTGGPAGEGWDLGRSVFLSDVAAALGNVAGVDHVQDLKLLLNGQTQGASVAVPSRKIAVVGAIHIQLV